jgi:DNA-binding MarR family transcriptional regulator
VLVTDTTDDAPWLTPEQDRAWISVLALTQALPAALDAQLKRDAGMNCFEYLVLARLSEAPGRTMGMSALAVLAQGSLSRLSHAVTRLEESGWVTRRPSPEDGRHIEAQLTAAGWKKVQRVAPGHVREVRRLVVDVLSPTQLAQLGRTARAVVEAAAPGWLDSALVLSDS